MGTSYSKSNSIAVASLVALACASSSSVDAARPFSSTAFLPKTCRGSVPRSILQVRGGEESTIAPGETQNEKSLDEKVFAAMEKLGLSVPGDDDEVDENGCKNGVCPMPGQKTETKPQGSQDPVDIADRISKDMNIDSYMAMAAVGATSTLGDKNIRIFDETAARAMIQSELDLIASIPEDSEDVQALVGEGFDVFMSRRALAFAENNLEDARAILLADKMDAEEEAEAAAAKSAPSEGITFEPMAASPTPSPSPSTYAPTYAPTSAPSSTNGFVEIKSNYDPTKLPTTKTPTPAPTTGADPANMPKPARKEDVVFECTTDQLQEIVLESPVPVLLDVYADWCGPCKALGPALEDMAIKAGGMFRLVKLNSDNEKPVSQALEVTALPTVFGISEGKIVHMFQGMPKNQQMMQNFMMGLFGAAQFNPAVTTEEMEKYKVLTNKLIKSASAASFSFSMRERLTERVVMKLDAMVKDDSVVDVEASATLIKRFLNNIINNPYEDKYRKINLANKVVAAKIGNNKSCIAVLKMVGFKQTGTDMFYKADKKVINIAPLVVARDTLEKWIQRNRKEMAAAARKRKDELDRANLVFEEEEEEEEEEVVEVDPTACKLKLRLDGKNKVHDVTLHEDDPLSKILEELEVDMDAEEEVQITCVAKRLVVKSSDKEAMAKSLGEHRLKPAAVVVVKVGKTEKVDVSKMKERAAEKRARKTGSHTMQSIGVYSTEDNNKSNLIDGGGGVLYEHDITDTEDEGEEEAKAEGEDAVDVAKEVSEEATEETEETAAATP